MTFVAFQSVPFGIISGDFSVKYGLTRQTALTGHFYYRFIVSYPDDRGGRVA